MVQRMSFEKKKLLFVLKKLVQRILLVYHYIYIGYSVSFTTRINLVHTVGN